MTIHLVRHGLAVERGSGDYSDDSLRPLTAKGMAKTRRVAKGLLALGVAFDVLLTSPYLRALQTAEIIEEVFAARKKLVVTGALAPEGDPGSLVAHINREHRKAKALMLVGHEPYLSEFASVLVTGKMESILKLKKAGYCRISTVSANLRYGKCAVLESLLTPREMMAMRGKNR